MTRLFQALSVLSLGRIWVCHIQTGDWTLSHVSLHDIDTETSVSQSVPEAGCPWWSEGSGPKALALHYPLAGLRLLQHVLPFLQLIVLFPVCKRWTGVWTAWIKYLEGRFSRHSLFNAQDLHCLCPLQESTWKQQVNNMFHLKF